MLEMHERETAIFHRLESDQTLLIPEDRASSLKDEIMSNPNHYTIHDANLALYDRLTKPHGKRRALPPEVILEILAQPPCWVVTDRESFLLTRFHFNPGFQTEKILTTRKLSKDDILALRRVVVKVSCCKEWDIE